MKYEFHVGDYVETRAGDVGYLISQTEWVPTYVVPCGSLYTERRVYDISPKPELVFVRIGQYDFDKKDEGKIKPLQKSWILEDAEGKGEYYFDSREVIKKINELAEAVNRLEENDTRTVGRGSR